MKAPLLAIFSITLLAAILIALAQAAAPGRLEAGQAETPSLAVTPTTVATPPPIAKINAALTNEGITWPPVPGAASISITGRVSAININASNVCGPVSQVRREQLTLDETLPGTATSFVLPLPSLPVADRWLVISYDPLEITARDADGVVVAGFSANFRAESCMVVATGTRVSADVLPGTGGGATDTGINRIAFLGLAAAALVVGAGSLALVRVARPRR
ncbi:MAG: hypothetical protein WEB52_09870 [Dehalococcoidia bacterium]